MSRHSLPLVAAALLAAGAPLAAQQQSPDTTALSPVVVTATKVPVPAGASTAATTVVSGAELRARGAVSLLDALRAVPGIALGRTSGPGSQTSIFLRGGNSNFTKVLVDGVPMNVPGGAIDLGSFTTDDVERIEIVRGPASALYGSDAMTGVVQIFTKRGGPSELAVRGASRDAQYDATASVAREARLGAATSVRGSLNGGYHRGNGFLPFNNQFRDATSSAALGLDGARGSATASATYADSRYHFPTTDSGEPTDSNAYTGAGRLSLSANGLWRVAERLALRAQLGRARTLSGSSNLPDSPGDTGSRAFFSRSHGTTLRQLADLQLVGTLPRAVTATLGAAAESQRATSRGWSEYGGFASTSHFDESRTNRAVYGSLVDAMRVLTVDVSGRVERLHDRRSVGTGRVGLATRVVPRTVLRASVARAFKEPTFDQLFDVGFSRGEPNLRPERSYARELGFETRLAGDRLSLGATAFDQHFADLVQYRFFLDPDSAARFSNYYNVEAATSRGLELEARLALAVGLSARGSYTLQRTRITNPGNGSFGTETQGQPLLRRPRRTASLDAAWVLPRASLSATATRVGARADYDFSAYHRVRLDPYTLLDAAAELPLLGDRSAHPYAALTLRAENLTGARYQSVYGYRTPGRTIFVGVRLRD